MRISILGAGAIGCYLAASLHAAGAEVRLIARGLAFDAIQRGGIRVEGDVTHTARVVVDRMESAAPSDVLISCVKAYALPDLSGDIARLCKPDGLWVCAVNGLPWWYSDQPLSSVDPGGLIRAAFPVERTVSCVVYVASEVTSPGAITVSSTRGLSVGMADGGDHSMLARVAAQFQSAGIATTITRDARSAVWNKLFGNIGMNTISALTGYTADRVLADPELKRLLIEVITEAMLVAAAEGATIESDAIRRVAVMGRLGAFRTSMLQDVEADRPLELDAILGAMLEVAGRRSVEVPASRRLYALLSAFAQTRGLLPA
jgi:2-dehydropantoate 2-reductase